MASKKYLSLEEAAQFLGLRTDEVIRMREKGDLRGFADRGTWKFKSDDVEEAKRRRTPDSNPDVPLMSDDEDSVLSFDEDLSAQATMIRGKGSTSDSDVRLVLDAPLAGSSAEIPIAKGPGSDSDVRLVGFSDDKPLAASDSDVKLIKPKASDSGLRLSDSDSDVRLAAAPGSDSDVKLLAPSHPGGRSSASGPAGSAAGPGSGILDLDAGDSVLLDPDSGIGIGADSGIRLTGSSSLRLTSDSGIRLSQPADSGILLEGPADSGIRLGDTGASGLLGLGSSLGLAGASSIKMKSPKPPATDDLDVTAPMLLPSMESDSGRTDPEVPLLGDDDDLMPKRKKPNFDDTAAETSVIMFDEDEDLDDVAATMVKKKSSGLSSKELDASSFDLDTDDTSEFADDELEVADDVLGEDDELEEMEVFESDDDDFDETFAEGASAADFSPRGLNKAVVPSESEWGGGTVALMGFTTVVLALGVVVAVDLLRTVWGGGGAVYEGELIGTFASFFK